MFPKAGENEGHKVEGSSSLMAVNIFDDGSRMCQIEEGLYLGSLGDASNKDRLKRLNVTHILTVASLGPAYPRDFIHKVVNVMDSEDTCIKQHFEECFNFIDEAKSQGGSILVHCFMGISRSVTVVVAYLMKRRGMRLSQALQHVRSRRPQASPNSGFLLQLKDFESSLSAVQHYQNSVLS